MYNMSSEKGKEGKITPDPSDLELPTVGECNSHLLRMIRVSQAGPFARISSFSRCHGTERQRFATCSAQGGLVNTLEAELHLPQVPDSIGSRLTEREDSEYLSGTRG